MLTRLVSAEAEGKCFGNWEPTWTGQSARASLRQLHLGHSLLVQQGAEAELLMSAARCYRYPRDAHLKPTVLRTIGYLGRETLVQSALYSGIDTNRLQRKEIFYS